MEIQTNTISPPAVTVNPATESKVKLETSPSSQQEKAEKTVAQTEIQNQVNRPVELSEDDKQALDKLNQRLEQLSVGVTFSVDESTQSSIVKMVDKSTNEVVKQFPNDDALKLIKHLQEYLNSVNQKVLQDNRGLTGALLNEII